SGSLSDPVGPVANQDSQKVMQNIGMFDVESPAPDEDHQPSFPEGLIAGSDQSVHREGVARDNNQVTLPEGFTADNDQNSFSEEVASDCGRNNFFDNFDPIIDQFDFVR
ncbi:hypothetical protein LTR04_003588, partial [Oleoguttula sp. CCFEE 6159]